LHAEQRTFRPANSSLRRNALPHVQLTAMGMTVFRQSFHAKQLSADYTDSRRSYSEICVNLCNLRMDPTRQRSR
jgi:hypothetical protein